MVHDSSLSRFLYSYENRIIAKKLLKEKGLKRIKIGIEGFPTFAERVKRGANGEKLEGEQGGKCKRCRKSSYISTLTKTHGRVRIILTITSLP